MKSYTGTRELDGLVTVKKVTVRDGNRTYPLPMRHAKHSSEFNWGYGGWGPMQLGLCLLGDYLHPKHIDDYPSDLCEKLMMNIVSKLPRGNFTITTQDLKDAIANG